MKAAKEGHLATVQMLLDKGAVINSKSKVSNLGRKYAQHSHIYIEVRTSNHTIYIRLYA